LVLLGFTLAGLAFAGPVFAAETGGAVPPKGIDFWSQILSLSESWLSPYRNALYLYLRLAGVVWICVEWIAAALLWRAHSLFCRTLRTGGGIQ
jgi:hypothetical protein